VTGLFFLNSSREGLKHYTLDVQPEVIVGIAQPPYTALQFISDNNQHVHAHSYAVLAKRITPLRLPGNSPSAAASRRKTSGHSEVYDTSGLSPDLAATYSHSWSAFNPKPHCTTSRARCSWPMRPSQAASRSGGYDTSALTNQAWRRRFNRKKVVSYETRRQSDGPRQAADRQRRAYYAKYTDLQVQEFQNLQYVTGNAGVANIRASSWKAPSMRCRGSH